MRVRFPLGSPEFMNTKRHSKLYNWLFLCNDGNYIYGQTPNLPIIIAAIAFILSLVITDPTIKSLVMLIFRLSIITWAVLELAWGVNNYRRLLGLIVILVVSIGILIS